MKVSLLVSLLAMCALLALWSSDRPPPLPVSTEGQRLELSRSSEEPDVDSPADAPDAVSPSRTEIDPLQSAIETTSTSPPNREPFDVRDLRSKERVALKYAEKTLRENGLEIDLEKLLADPEKREATLKLLSGYYRESFQVFRGQTVEAYDLADQKIARGEYIITEPRTSGGVDTPPPPESRGEYRLYRTSFDASLGRSTRKLVRIMPGESRKIDHLFFELYTKEAEFITQALDIENRR